MTCQIQGVAVLERLPIVHGGHVQGQRLKGIKGGSGTESPSIDRGFTTVSNCACVRKAVH